MTYTNSYGSGWQNSPATTTPVAAVALNNIETQYSEAVNSFPTDLYQPFVISGLDCTKDGVTANKLNVAAGVIYLKSTQDSTVRRFSVTATSFTTSTINTTYYLGIYPVAGNGTGSAPTYGFDWGTSLPSHTNYYLLATVKTDGSGNIQPQTAGAVGVLDNRTTKGVGLISGPQMGKASNGLMAMVYELPSGGVDDVPGNLLGCQIVGPINWTNFNFAGRQANMYMRIAGMIKADWSEAYTFYLTTDDAARLYIAGTDMFKNTAWQAQSPTTYTSSTITLVAGNWYPIIIEHTQGNGGESLQLQWSSSHIAQQTIPADHMQWQWPSEDVITPRYVHAHYAVTVGGNTVWHTGNMGAGSGLDADKLDSLNYTVGSTAPSSPSVNDVWIDTSVNLG